MKGLKVLLGDVVHKQIKTPNAKHKKKHLESLRGPCPQKNQASPYIPERSSCLLPIAPTEVWKTAQKLIHAHTPNRKS